MVTLVTFIFFKKNKINKNNYYIPIYFGVGYHHEEVSTDIAHFSIIFQNVSIILKVKSLQVIWNVAVIRWSAMQLYSE